MGQSGRGPTAATKVANHRLRDKEAAELMRVTGMTMQDEELGKTLSNSHRHHKVAL